MARVLNQFKEACESANGDFASGPGEFVCSNKHGTMSMKNFKGRRNESAQVEVANTPVADGDMRTFDVKGRIKDADRVVHDKDRDAIVAEDSEGKSEVMLHNKDMDDEDNGGGY